MTIILIVINILTALCALILAAVRVIESIYELKKYPDLDTFQEIVQVIKNFFGIEKYDEPENTTGTATTGE